MDTQNDGDNPGTLSNLPYLQDLEQFDPGVKDSANSDSESAGNIPLPESDGASAVVVPEDATQPTSLSSPSRGRDSLEQLLQFNRDSIQERNVSVPDSDTSSRVENEDPPERRRDPVPHGRSLEQLEGIELHRFASQASAQGRNVPHPEPDTISFVRDDAYVSEESEISPTGTPPLAAEGPSSPRSRPRHPRGSALPPPGPPPGTSNEFLKKAKHLAEWLPHIKPVVQPDCRNSQARIFCYDYFDSEELPQRKRYTIRKDTESNRLIKSDPELPGGLNHIEDIAITKRMLLVEDLFPELIWFLGDLFDIDPEFFAEHLNRSGYQCDSYKEKLPGAWVTRNFKKSWESLRWYRPVLHKYETAKRLYDRSLRKRAGKPTDEGFFEPWEEVRYSAEIQGPKKKEEEEEKQGDEDDDDDDDKKEEEGKKEGDRKKGEDEDKELSETRTNHNWTVCSNIFRQGWRLSTRLNDPGENKVSASWEERASLFIYEKATAPIILLLLDPKPHVIDQQKKKSSTIKWTGMFSRRSQASESDTEDSNVEVKLYQSLIPRQPLSLDSSGVMVGHLPGRNTRRDSRPSSPFRSWSQKLKRKVRTTCPTAEDLHSWIMYQYPHDRFSVVGDPIFDLLHVIKIDITAFLDQLDSCLYEISQDSLDDYLMEKRVVHWRTLMNKFETQVPEIRCSLESFVKFAYNKEVERPKAVQHLIDELDDRVDGFAKKMENAYAALRADLSVLESKRSIAEAENVTKLTELAFAFIPLTFSASFLTIPLLELQDRVPLQTFVVTALILACLSYGVRLIIRSDLVEHSRRRALETFWKRAGLKPGSKIPTHRLVFLTTREIWTHKGPILNFSLFLTILSISILPIAFLWTRTRLDVGLNAVITLLVLPFGIAVAWLFTSSTSHHRHGSGIPMWYRAGIWLSRHIPKRKARRNAVAEGSPA